MDFKLTSIHNTHSQIKRNVWSFQFSRLKSFILKHFAKHLGEILLTWLISSSVSSLMLTFGALAATFAASAYCMPLNKVLNFLTKSSSAPAKLFLTARRRARSGFCSTLVMYGMMLSSSTLTDNTLIGTKFKAQMGKSYIITTTTTTTTTTIFI